MSEMVKLIEAAAVRLGVVLLFVNARGRGDFEQAFAAMDAERAEALLPLPSSMFFNERERIVDLASRQRLPTMYNGREFVEIGGLIAYGVNLAELNRRAATYVDKILKGAKPSELPIEQPTKFELFINLKTAKALGVDVPAHFQRFADEVIE
jgi:putative ABC transport system substrate-binding protein